MGPFFATAPGSLTRLTPPVSCGLEFRGLFYYFHTNVLCGGYVYGSPNKPIVGEIQSHSCEYDSVYDSMYDSMIV